eukprot:UN07028
MKNSKTTNEEYRLAIHHYNLAIKYDSTNAVYHNALGVLCENLLEGVDTYGIDVIEYAQTAKEHYELAIQYDPKNGKYHHNLALTIQSFGYGGKNVRDHFELAVKYEPESALFHHSLADFIETSGACIKHDNPSVQKMMRVKEYKLAREHYELAIKYDSKRNAWYT